MASNSGGSACRSPQVVDPEQQLLTLSLPGRVPVVEVRILLSQPRHLLTHCAK